MKSRLTPARIPGGFRFAAMACGLKKYGGLDLALVVAEKPATAAAVFTTNLVQAAPVRVSRENLRRSPGSIRAIIVNSGNANCSTGPQGTHASLATIREVARQLGCRPEQVLVCSTGVIGVPLRVEKILHAVPALTDAVEYSPRAFAQFTRAIMTTDTRPKWAAASCLIGSKTVRLLGCAKGAGMIHPQLATMLAFVLTDAAISPALLRPALREVAGRTFNCISVDGDTSTNDTLAVLASGASGASIAASGVSRSYRSFLAALEEVCRSLAMQIVADGEGARRVAEIEVRGASNAQSAQRIARTIATSPLVKTALAGADPNWGRILAAAGRAGVRFDPDRAEIWLAGIKVYSRGRALPFDERVAHRKLSAKQVRIVLDLRTPARKKSRSDSGRVGRARVWTCDFTRGYVDINSSYRT